MTATSDGILLEIIGKSLNYPSGDNCQPFTFKILSPTECEILYSHELAKHRLNFGDGASVLALGTLIESLRIQASCAGYELIVSNLLESLSDTKWAQIKINKKDILDDSDLKLADAMKLRATDRRSFSKNPIPENIKQKIKNEVLKFKEIIFTFNDTLPVEIKKIVLDIEQEAWKDAKMGQDLIRWIRFTKKSARETRDGLPWTNLGAAFFLKPLMMLWKNRPKLYKISMKLGGASSARATLQKQLENSGGFGWFHVNEPNIKNMVDVGTCYFRVWLILTSHGYGLQPITSSTFGSYAYIKNLLPSDWPYKLKALYGVFIQRMQNEYRLERSFFPVWGFRTGKISPLEDGKRTYRRKLEQSLIR